jgi:hypothetical protein
MKSLVLNVTTRLRVVSLFAVTLKEVHGSGTAMTAYRKLMFKYLGAAKILLRLSEQQSSRGLKLRLNPYCSEKIIWVRFDIKNVGMSSFLIVSMPSNMGNMSTEFPLHFERNPLIC